MSTTQIKVYLVKGDRGIDTFVGKKNGSNKMVFFKDLMVHDMGEVYPKYSEVDLQAMGEDGLITVHQVVEYEHYIDAVIDVRNAAKVKIKTKQAKEFVEKSKEFIIDEVDEVDEVDEEKLSPMMQRIVNRRENEKVNASAGTVKIVTIDEVNDYLENGYWELYNSHAIENDISFVIIKVIS